ncbi:unnamed protein product [Peronospora farinosa]|uniref:EGF-like domain-containing protein n=1 Tax=Peronospora farinosa TaxID=134698 RepID=A0AAV0TIR9_9STRA|nr:unnamed protein product [Peronospora farinosa]CAI5720482.1 unnamed protein product [Peronospora farinosa]
MLQHSVAVLLICISATSAHLVQEPMKKAHTNSRRVSVPSIGSVAAGCSLCRDSGACSMAMNDTSSGVFCGDIHATVTKKQPCCCAYYTECRATSTAQTCECGGGWPFALRHERLTAIEEVADDTEKLVRDSFTSASHDPMDSQMSVLTEILIHLSAYLALLVFAVYVDKWVECFSDFRRNQMVTYSKATDTKLLRFRQRFGKRRRESQTDGEIEDNLPLLVLESPIPTSRPPITFDAISDADSLQQEKDKEESTEEVSDQVLVITATVDVVQEVSIRPNESPTELKDIPLK